MKSKIKKPSADIADADQPRDPDVREMIDELHPADHKIYEAMRKLRDEMDRAQLASAIAIAQQVDMAMGNPRSSDLGRLPYVLGMTSAELLRLQPLAGCYSDDELNQFQTRRMANGRLMPLPQIIVLACIGSRKIRHELLEASYAESLTRQELLERVPMQLVSKHAGPIGALLGIEPVTIEQLRDTYDAIDEANEGAQNLARKLEEANDAIGELVRGIAW